MSNKSRAAWLFLVLAIAGCGGGGGSAGTSTGGFPSNTAPTANFAFACADLVCNFTSTSTDQDVGDAIVAYSWSFNDGPTAAVTTPSPTHTFTKAGTFDVILMVGDRANGVSSVKRTVTVTAPSVPASPHAGFTSSCASLDCSFTDTSTYDAGSVFQSRIWDFGDGTATATGSAVTHRYAATILTTYTVKLTVTDANGKTSSNTQTVVTSPPATSLGCVSGNCTLALTQASRVTATLVSHSCAAQQNQVRITAPVSQTIFPDGCVNPVGTVVAINGGSLFAAGTTLEFTVLSGSFPSSSLVFTPSIRVSGDYATGWTLTFDDGYGGPGEPDFNDMVILIKATP